MCFLLTGINILKYFNLTCLPLFLPISLTNLPLILHKKAFCFFMVCIRKVFTGQRCHLKCHFLGKSWNVHLSLYRFCSRQEGSVRYKTCLLKNETKQQMLKPPPIIPRTSAFSVLKCNCRTKYDNIGQIFQNPWFATLGVLKIRLTHVGPRFVRKYLK